MQSTESSSVTDRVPNGSPYGEPDGVPFVPETAFGVWFLRTHTWEHHVLRVAIDDLKRLIDTPLPAAPVIVDVGCGQGISFRLLAQAFKPQHIIGIDFHEPSLTLANQSAQVCRQHADTRATGIDVLHGDCAKLPLPDTCDMCRWAPASPPHMNTGGADPP